MSKKISAKSQIKSLTAQVETLTATVQNQGQVIAAAENAAYGDGVPATGPASVSPTVSCIAQQVSYLKSERVELENDLQQAFAETEKVKAEATKVFGVMAEKTATAIGELKTAAEVNATAAQRRDTMVQAFIDLTNKGPLTAREQAIFRAGFVTSTIDDVRTAQVAAEIDVVPTAISGKGTVGGNPLEQLMAALGGLNPNIGARRREEPAPALSDFGYADDDDGDDFGGSPFGR